MSKIRLHLIRTDDRYYIKSRPGCYLSYKTVDSLLPVMVVSLLDEVMVHEHC